jgi:hypothetical protein
MPLEIRQIGIRLQVDGGQGRQDADGSDVEPNRSAGLTQDERASIIDECVRRVLRELKLASER